MSGDASRSEVVSAMRTYDPPPEGFDPRVAPHDALRRHGLPRRPDRSQEPHLARLWNLAFARPVTFVKAELEVDPVLSGRDPFRGWDPQYGPDGWGGVMRGQQAGTDFAEAATWVFAQWVVPEVIDYHRADQDLNVAFWVGLDTVDQILQAGVSATVSGDDVSYYAWTEWWTREFQDPAVTVTNFPITAGTTVAVLICAPEPDFGDVSILNLSTQVGTHVGVPAPPNTTLSAGGTAWVVESPTLALPYFYPLIFHNCTAGTQHGLFHLTPGGIVTEITDSDPTIDAPGPPITQTSICGPSTAVVEWEGFGEEF